jgi:hypothetical protein
VIYPCKTTITVRYAFCVSDDHRASLRLHRLMRRYPRLYRLRPVLRQQRLFRRFLRQWRPIYGWTDRDGSFAGQRMLGLSMRWPICNRFGKRMHYEVEQDQRMNQ